VYSIKRSARELRLISDIFFGLQQIEENFVVSLLEEEQTADIRIKLIPRPAWPQTEAVMLTISSVDYRIREVEIRDYIGGITRFIIRKQAAKYQFPEDFFRFEIPQDARVIEEEE
jgi:outer membrane lipoprotein-sorting protein